MRFAGSKLLTIGIALGLLSAGCGDAGTGDAGEGGAASTATGAGGTSPPVTSIGSAGSGGADPQGTGGAGGSLQEPTRAATVSVTNWRYPEYADGGELGTFYGAFGQELTATGPDEREPLGDCFFGSREVSADVPPGVELVELDHLEVEGTLVPVTPVPEPDGSYHATVDQPLLAPGLEVRFTGGGSGAPTLDLSQVAPSQVSLLGPDLTGGLARDADATFTWDIVGDSGGLVVLTMETERQEGATLFVDRIDCSVPIDAGELVVPVDFLERLQGEAAFFALGATHGTETQVEDWRVHFVLAHYEVHLDLALVGGPEE